MSQARIGVLIVWTVFCLQFGTGSDFYTSQVGLDSLLRTEKLLLSNLEKYVEAAQARLTEING